MTRKKLVENREQSDSKFESKLFQIRTLKVENRHGFKTFSKFRLKGKRDQKRSVIRNNTSSAKM